MTNEPNKIDAPFDDKGKAVLNRFKTPAKARSALSILDRDDEKHAKDRLLHKGMINGNRPYNSDRLKAMQQGWRCNVNFREGEAIRDMNAGAYWSMMNDVPYYLDVSYTDPTIDPTMSFFWGNTFAEEYTEMIQNWRAWHYNVSLVIQDFLIPGVSGFHFKDKWTWQPKGVKREDLRFKVSDASNPEDLSLLFIRDSISPYKLHAAMQNESAAKKMGWNPDMVKKAVIAKYISKTLTTEQQNSATMSEITQQKFKDGDFMDAASELEDLNIVWFYVREPSGKWSEYILVEDAQVEGYLLEGSEKYESLSQVFIPFFYTIGDGDVGSVRGLGNRMFGTVEYSNRLLCGIMDGAWLASAMLVQNQGGANGSLTIERIGPIAVLPSDVKPINQAFTPQFSQLADVRNLITTMQNNNNGVQVRSNQQGNQRVSATQTQYQMERDTQFSGQQVGNFYIYWAMLHQEIVRRLLSPGWTSVMPGYKERTAFIEACTKRGIPEMLLKNDMIKVRIMESVGSGSNIMKKQSSNRILGMSNGFDEIGRSNAMVDAVASEVGYRRASRYITNLNRNMVPSNESSIATLENSVMSMGKPVSVGADQKHLIHGMTHLQVLMETVQAYMQAAQTGQQMDPRAMLPLWQEGIQHLGEHIQRMNMDPRYKGDIDMLEKALAQILPIVKQAMQVAQTADSDEQEVQQAQLQNLAQNSAGNQQLQLKIQELQGRLQLEARKTEAELQMKAAKAEQAMAIKDAQARQKMDLKERAATGRRFAEQEGPAEIEEEMELPPM